MARQINRIILHCSATPEGRAVTVQEIRGWHLARGFTDIGYHWVVLADGTIAAGRPEEEIGAHTQGQNADSIGICYIGGMDTAGKAPKDTRTPAQRSAILALIEAIRIRHGRHVTVHGHNEFANKACPSFDVQAELAPPADPGPILPVTAMVEVVDGRPAPRPSLTRSRTMGGVSIAGIGLALKALGPVLDQAGPFGEIAGELQTILPVAQELAATSPVLGYGAIVVGLAVVAYARWDDHRRGLR